MKEHGENHRKPEDQRIRRTKDQETTGPDQDQRTRGPKGLWTRGRRDERTKGPQDQGTKGPVDQRTKGPEDQRTRRPQGQEQKRPIDLDAIATRVEAIASRLKAIATTSRVEAIALSFFMVGHGGRGEVGHGAMVGHERQAHGEHVSDACKKRDTIYRLGSKSLAQAKREIDDVLISLEFIGFPSRMIWPCCPARHSQGTPDGGVNSRSNENRNG